MLMFYLTISRRQTFFTGQHRQSVSSNTQAMSVLRETFPDQLSHYDGDSLLDAIGLLAAARRQYDIDSSELLHRLTSLDNDVIGWTSVNFGDDGDSSGVGSIKMAERRQLAELCRQRFSAFGFPLSRRTSDTEDVGGRGGEMRLPLHTTEPISDVSMLTTEPRIVKIRRRRKPRRSLVRASTTAPSAIDLKRQPASALEAASSHMHLPMDDDKKTPDISRQDIAADDELFDELSEAAAETGIAMPATNFKPSTETLSDVTFTPIFDTLETDNNGNSSDGLDAETATKIEHALHYSSMAVLGVFVVQVWYIGSH
jgi:hypothetical protein